jgi:hypothetical protein
MRPRRSIGGPLILITVGVLFLIHTVSPEFQIVDIFSHFWPYFLILWGVIQLLEIAAWSFRGAPTPYNGISGGGWFVVLLICFAGFTMFEVQKPGAWWREVGFQHGINEMLGDEHDFTVSPVQKMAGDAPKVVIENFRGDAKVTGVDGPMVLVSGHKKVHALNAAAAGRVDKQTPVEVLVQGKTIIIRCNQDRADSRSSVTTDLEISIPKQASLDATGIRGDFEISALSGDVDISSENAGVRIQEVKGSVHVDTRRSDEIRLSDIGGAVTLRGHGDDVELSKIAGEVNVTGDYSGEVTLEDIAKPVRVESMRTTFNAARVAGDVKLARGSLDAHQLMGPVKVKASATDVTLADFTGDLEIEVDKGDVGLRPGRLPLAKMTVHTRSGDIDLALPQTANFGLVAATDHGSIDSDLGAAFTERPEGGGTRLEGSVGEGPELGLVTNHGDLTLHRDNDTHGGPKPPSAPRPPRPPREPHEAPVSES